MKNHLPVRKCHVYCTLHSLEVILPFLALERNANKFPIPYLYSILRSHHRHKLRNIISCYLMSKTSAAAMEHNYYLIFEQAKFLCNFFIKDVFFCDMLNFQIVIPASQCANLMNSPAESFIRNF